MVGPSQILKEDTMSDMFELAKRTALNHNKKYNRIVIEQGETREDRLNDIVRIVLEQAGYQRDSMALADDVVDRAKREGLV